MNSRRLLRGRDASYLAPPAVQIEQQRDHRLQCHQRSPLGMMRNSTSVLLPLLMIHFPSSIHGIDQSAVCCPASSAGKGYQA
jgi:hypothetical protein